MDDSFLREMWRKDRYDHEIGAVLGRSRENVGDRRRALGLLGVKYRGHPPEARAKCGAARAKLTANDISEIRDLAKSRVFRQKQIAHFYGVNQQHVSAILNHRCWTHL
jgi:hypothetical protein